MPRRLPPLAPRQLALCTAALAMLGACAQHPDPAASAALDGDLALARQQGATQVVSPQELTGAVATTPARAAEPAREPVRTRVIEREHVVYRTTPASYASVAPAPVAAAAAAPAYDPYPAPRRDGTYDGGYDRGTYGNGGYGTGGYGRGSSGSGGYGTYGTARQPVYRRPQGHAQRDGVVGAAAGAMLGVAVSHRKDRLRGGLLGAVAGGALGALYGHTVDRTP
ncbi:hypothetical protein tb265_26960 [Gemmatimonadetes bacterium T265]|nr:hypothetical protein tb265_26960 [Gemmatimonadetes bacterium T265]